MSISNDRWYSALIPLLHMILQIFHIIALTLLQNSSLFAVCSYLKHSNTGEIARAKKRRSMINILVKLCSLAKQDETGNTPQTKNPPTEAEGFVLLRIICYVRKLDCQQCKKFCKRIGRKPGIRRSRRCAGSFSA